MNAQLFEERTVFKVVVPLRVERIGFSPDLDVTPDFDFGRINQTNPNRFAIRCSFAGVRRKLPGSPSAEPPGDDFAIDGHQLPDEYICL